MAITKIIYQDSSEDLMRAVAANGEAMTSLIEYDRGVKSASSDLVSKQLLEQYRPTDDHTACIHLIAMGNSDQYGFNRNGDYFAGDVLEKRAHTFVTNGHVFREHRNKDPKKALGQVKWAGYDPKGMQRVELIIHIDKDKAEEEYEMAKKGSALNFSMSCRVPNDRCSCCGNEAKTVSRYCDHLKYNMGRYMDGFHKYAFAYNDMPTFFDISRVKTPADRIARHLEYMFKDDESMAKAASAGQVLIPSAVAAAAEGINLDGFDIDEMSMAVKLAEAEEYMDTMSKSAAYGNSESYAANFLYPRSLMEKFSSAELATARSMAPEKFFREMAKRACVLSFPAFCQYLTGNPDVETDPLYKEACMCLPKVHRIIRIKVTRIVPVTSQFRMGSQFMSDSMPCTCPSGGDPVDQVMNSAEEKFSLDGDMPRRRVINHMSKEDDIDDVDDDDDKEDEEEVKKVVKKLKKNKKKDDDEEEEKAASLAECYGQYQIRALCDMNEIHGSDFLQPNALAMVVGANRGPAIYSRRG